MPSKRPLAFGAEDQRLVEREVPRSQQPEATVAVALMRISDQLDYIARLLETSAKAPSSDYPGPR
jgi:hypothetical protein